MIYLYFVYFFSLFTLIFWFCLVSFCLSLVLVLTSIKCDLLRSSVIEPVFKLKYIFLLIILTLYMLNKIKIKKKWPLLERGKRNFFCEIAEILGKFSLRNSMFNFHVIILRKTEFSNFFFSVFRVFILRKLFGGKAEIIYYM